jgi:hypothetical protein
LSLTSLEILGRPVKPGDDSCSAAPRGIARDRSFAKRASGTPSEMLSQQHPIDARMTPLLLDHWALRDFAIS